tara:strand:+ start:1666 stop:1791 length:126 start_codon:yes stop_codon:yes gene_type:complete
MKEICFARFAMKLHLKVILLEKDLKSEHGNAQNVEKSGIIH